METFFDYFPITALVVAILTILSETVFKFSPRLEKKYRFSFLMISLVFGLITAVLAIQEQKESNEFKNKFSHSEVERIKLQAELIKLQNQHFTEKNKIKSITASIVAKITGSLTKENFPFRTSVHVPDFGSNDLVFFPKLNSNLPTIELGFVDQITFSNHEIGFSTFWANFRISGSQSFLFKDMRSIYKMSSLKLFIPIEKWPQTNYMDLTIESLRLDLKINGISVLVIDRPVNLKIGRAKYTSATGEVILDIQNEDFILM